MVTKIKEHEAHSVPSWLAKDLDKVGTQAIEEAVHAAEKTTAGEIVPIIVQSSTINATAPALLAVLALVFVYILSGYFAASDSWHFAESSWPWYLASALALALGVFLGRTKTGQMLFTPAEEKTRQVHQRALLAFYQAGLNKTAGRTGILLFISWRERQAVVLADDGIAKFCDNKVFDEVCRAMIQGAKSKDLSGGIVKAVKLCGSILAQHIPILPGDTNELHDTLRIID